MAEDAENHINSAMRGRGGRGKGGGRSLPSANPDNVAAGGVTDALCVGGGGRRVGVGQITAHSNPCSSFSLSSFPLCIRQGFDENFCFQQCNTELNKEKSSRRNFVLDQRTLHTSTSINGKMVFSLHSLHPI